MPSVKSRRDSGIGPCRSYVRSQVPPLLCSITQSPVTTYFMQYARGHKREACDHAKKMAHCIQVGLSPITSIASARRTVTLSSRPCHRPAERLVSSSNLSRASHRPDGAGLAVKCFHDPAQMWWSLAARVVRPCFSHAGSLWWSTLVRFTK